MKFFKSINLFFQEWLQKPYGVFIACLIFLGINIIFDGTLFKIRELYLNKQQLLQASEEIKIKNERIVSILERLKDPTYLEKEARNRLNLAGEGDLIFIFPEDE